MFRHKSLLLSVIIALAISIIGDRLYPSTAFALPCGIDCLNVTNTPTVVVNLNGVDQTASYTLTLSLNETLTQGWNGTITSTQFATGTTPTRTLSTTASSLTSVSEVCTPGQICLSAPQNSVTYPITIPAGSTAPTAVKFYNAAALSGIGTFDLSATIAITVPANAYAGAYNSTITLAYVSGP